MLRLCPKEAYQHIVLGQWPRTRERAEASFLQQRVCFPRLSFTPQLHVLGRSSECGTWSHAVMSSLGARARRGGGRAPALRVARCRTPSGVGVRGVGLVPLGPVGVRQGPGWSRIGPYISRTLIRGSRVIRRGSSGPLGQIGVPTGVHRNPVLARRDPTGLDGSLDCPVSMHNRCTDPLGTPRRPHEPSGAPSGPNGPPAAPSDPV